MKFLFALLLLALTTGAHADMQVTTGTSVVKVLECLRANTPAQLSISDLRLDAKGAGVSTRHLAAKFYSRRDERGLRAMLHITAPADLAGMRYLLVEAEPDDALYLYLPALGKARRVNSAGSEAEIAGTTLNYSDLRLISVALSASSITHERSAVVAGHTVQVLRFSPAIADSPYRRVLASVHDESCAILRADFQNAERTVKQYRVDPASLMRSGRHSYASRSTIEDLVRGSTVQLSLGGVNAAPKLASRLFDPKSFFKGE